MADNASNFELVKENIQPIRQGRNLIALNTAITPQSNRQLHEQQQIFETELRTYSGDDPLDVWCRYIKWVEQNFPRGGKEGNLNNIVEQCISALKDMPKYKNDEHFVEICLKYANMIVSPLEVYNYMYSNNIGTELAIFYESWGWEMERMGNLKCADAVLTEGINRRAQPVEKLQTAQRQFESRIGRRIPEEMECINEPTSEEQRYALNKLKTIGKKQAAPVSRVGLSQMGPPGTLNRMQQPPPPQNQINKVPFKLCHDSNVSSGILPTNSKENNFMPSAAAEKENISKPDKWTKAKVRQKHAGNVPFEAVSNYNKPFEVHVDEDIPELLVTPRKLPEGLSVLSLKKHEHNPPVAIFEPADPMKRPMYDKFKVYGGAGEFSFEEIRSAKWFAEQRKLQEIKEREEAQERSKRLEQQVMHLHEEILFLHQKCNNLSQPTREIVQNNNGETCTRLQNQLLVPDSHQRTEQCAKSNVLPTAAENGGFSMLPSAQQQQTGQITGRGDFATDSSTHVCLKQGAEMKENSTLYPQQQHLQPENGELTIVPQVEKSFVQTENLASGNNSYNISGFSQMGSHPSTPAISSIREAMSMVREFYNEHSPAESRADSFHCIKESGNFKEGTRSNVSLFKDPTVSVPVLQPTCTEQNHNQLDTLLNSLKVDSAAENRPPPGYVQEKQKREIKGILVPSVDIPCVPLEDQLQEDENYESPKLDGINAQYENLTLASLCDHEQFEANAVSVSTPFPSLKPFCPKEDSGSYKMFSAPEMGGPKLKSAISLHQPNSQCSVAYTAISQDEENYHTKNEFLSVILENSHENYSKSSSSNNSSGQTSSTYLHRTGHHASLSSSNGQCSKTSFQPKTLSQVTINYERQQKQQRPETRIAIAKTSQKYCKDDSSSNLSYNLIGVCPLNVNPFDPANTEIFLSRLKSPVTNRDDYIRVNCDLKIKENESIIVGMKKYCFLHFHAEGSYAKVYSAVEEIGIGEIPKYTNALKVCMSTSLWEFYICSELHLRLEALTLLPDIRKSVMKVTAAAQYNNAVVLASKFFTNGSLVDIVNCYKKSGLNMPECLIIYFTIELLHIISKVHQCDIIHGDVKPDNFLLIEVPIIGDLDDMLATTNSLCLIDFGRAIDLRFFPTGAAFTVKVKTSGFACPEMQDGLPWSYQTDWFGMLATIHVMLFSDYMNIRKNSKGQWEITKQFKRYWQKELWESLFHTLLNIPSCDQIPDMAPFIQGLVKSLQEPSRYRDLRIKTSQLISMLQER